jgi:hypothetical protein
LKVSFYLSITIINLSCAHKQSKLNYTTRGRGGQNPPVLQKVATTFSIPPQAGTIPNKKKEEKEKRKKREREKREYRYYVTYM